jgi:hypothetical protein
MKMLMITNKPACSLFLELAGPLFGLLPGCAVISMALLQLFENDAENNFFQHRDVDWCSGDQRGYFLVDASSAFNLQHRKLRASACSSTRSEDDPSEEEPIPSDSQDLDGFEEDQHDGALADRQGSSASWRTLQEFGTQNQPFFNDISGSKTSMKTAF